jgi:hypothetical protein
MELNHSLAGFFFSRFLLVGLFSFLVQKKVFIGWFSFLSFSIGWTVFIPGTKKENYWLNCFHYWSKKKEKEGEKEVTHPFENQRDREL